MSRPPVVRTLKVRRRAAGTYSRRHIDLQRVSAALCPAYETAASRHAASPHSAS
ncbi:putative leader peptide [Streptomyces sp. A 4/2]|uniref:putative leader peptide n=1 Tax=Streptomyces sp. A 4/2 TaxID=2934314 RepID=UPI0035ABC539